MVLVSSPESVIQGVTCEKVNQKVQNPPGFDLWLNSIRERVEGAFNEVQNTGRNEVLSNVVDQSLLGGEYRWSEREHFRCWFQL
jgi:hypothetical protein